jgi:hypothetical protein
LSSIIAAKQTTTTPYHTYTGLPIYAVPLTADQVAFAILGYLNTDGGGALLA